MYHLPDQEIMSPSSQHFAKVAGRHREQLWGADRFGEVNLELWASTTEVDGLADRVAGIFTQYGIDSSEHDVRFRYSKRHPALSLGLDRGSEGAKAWVFDFNSRYVGHFWARSIVSETLEARASLPDGAARLWAEVIPVGGNIPKEFDPQSVKALTPDIMAAHKAINAAMTSGGMANELVMSVHRRDRPVQ